jgi:prevent-host-death family protein
MFPASVYAFRAVRQCTLSRGIAEYRLELPGSPVTRIRHLERTVLRELRSGGLLCKWTIDYDHGNLEWSSNTQGVARMAAKGRRSMKEIAVSEFKAKCLSLLEEVMKTKTPLRITRRGIPLADVVPAFPEAEEKAWIGSMTGSLKIIGDIVSPVIDVREIEALRK